LYCVFDALLSVVAEKTSLHFFARATRRKAEGLVEAEVVQSLEDYISNDNDILPGSSHNFGLLGMLNQKVRIQKQIKNRTNEAVGKTREEAQQYLAKGRNTKL
jgi:hypothetical protein